MVTRCTLAKVETARQDVKKSRFVAIAGPITDEPAARQFIAAHSDRSANHNCWAWRLGQNYRFSDDGEPGGTAGKPILQAIDGQDMDGVVVVVTRWFGGVLLGSGGLIRAYGGTAAMCLRDAAKVLLIERTSATIECTFSDLALLQARLAVLAHVEVLDQTFTGTGAMLSLSVHETEREDVARLVADLTSGRAFISWDE